jgi:hypothetical protein
VFRDGAPHIEPAVARVTDGELRIEPVDVAAYPPGFVLRAASEVVVWTGDLVPPIEGTTLGQRRIAGYQRAFLRLLEPVQGESGTWVIFGDGDAAFRPDDWNRLDELLRREQLPQRDGTASSGPPEPTGGLLTVGLLLMLAILMGAGVALLNLPDGVPAGATVVLALLLLGCAIGGTLGIRRWWMEGLLVRVSRRQRQRAAIEGRAQPQQKSPPGWGTLSVFVLVGLTVGLGLLPLANEAYRSVAFPAGGALVGLLVGLAWVASIRFTPLNARSREPRS